MSSKGSLLLKIESLRNMSEKVQTYETTVEEAFYTQYQNAFTLSRTNHLRGDAADAFKNYLTESSVNLISGFLDVSADLTIFIQLFKEAFSGYETNASGAVGESALDNVEQELKTLETSFNGEQNELWNVLAAASQYITTRSLDLGGVNTSYSATHKSLETIRDDLYSMDDSCLREADALMVRIKDLRQLVDNIANHCYSNGRMIPGSLDNIASQPWFHKQSNVKLFLLLQEKPFAYSAGQVTVAEDQWVAGLCSDVYAYAGYSALGASYEAGVRDGTAFLKAKAYVFEANGYAQFTDYLRAEADVKVLYGETDLKAGFSENYRGFRAEAGVGVFKADGSLVLGTEDFNGYLKGGVEALTADAKAAFEFEDDGQFAIGFDASAKLASASVSSGLNPFDVDVRKKKKGKDAKLLGLDVSASSGAGAALWLESKTAIETDFVNINAATVKIKGVLGVGGGVSVTVPTVYFKLPW